MIGRVFTTALDNEAPGQAFARLFGAASDISTNTHDILMEGPGEEGFASAWEGVLEDVRYFNTNSGRHYKPMINGQGSLVLVGADITVGNDRDTENPRRFSENVGVMFCRAQRGSYGDEDAESPFETVIDEDGDERRVIRSDILCSLPIFLYEHSGLAFSHGSFGDSWDSGQIGFHYITRQAFINTWPSVDPDSEEAQELCRGCLSAELKEYAHWVTGDAWYFIVETLEGKKISGCGGFIGKLDYGTYPVVETMKEHVDEELHFLLEKAAETPVY